MSSLRQPVAVARQLLPAVAVVTAVPWFDPWLQFLLLAAVLSPVSLSPSRWHHSAHALWQWLAATAAWWVLSVPLPDLALLGMAALAATALLHPPFLLPFVTAPPPPPPSAARMSGSSRKSLSDASSSASPSPMAHAAVMVAVSASVYGTLHWLVSFCRRWLCGAVVTALFGGGGGGGGDEDSDEPADEVDDVCVIGSWQLAVLLAGAVLAYRWTARRDDISTPIATGLMALAPPPPPAASPDPSAAPAAVPSSKSYSSIVALRRCRLWPLMPAPSTDKPPPRRDSERKPSEAHTTDLPPPVTMSWTALLAAVVADAMAPALLALPSWHRWEAVCVTLDEDGFSYGGFIASFEWADLRSAAAAKRASTVAAAGAIPATAAAPSGDATGRSARYPSQADIDEEDSEGDSDDDDNDAKDRKPPAPATVTPAMRARAERRLSVAAGSGAVLAGFLIRALMPRFSASDAIKAIPIADDDLVSLAPSSGRAVAFRLSKLLPSDEDYEYLLLSAHHVTIPLPEAMLAVLVPRDCEFHSAPAALALPVPPPAPSTVLPSLASLRSSSSSATALSARLMTELQSWWAERRLFRLCTVGFASGLYRDLCGGGGGGGGADVQLALQSTWDSPLPAHWAPLEAFRARVGRIQ